MPLTNATIKAAQPQAKPYKLADEKGMYLEVAPSGGKWWRLKYRIEGKPDAQRQPPAGMIVHTDRGSQYASQEHQGLLSRHELVGSMSRKGNCWDNAVMERFFLNLKMERVWQRDYANHGEAVQDITEYIVGFYNSVRLHSTLGYRPPNAYERLMAETPPIEVSEIS